MKRTAIITGWVASLAVVFLLGHQLGRDNPADGRRDPGPDAPVEPTPAPGGGTEAAAEHSGSVVLNLARQLADEGRTYDAIDLIERYLANEPFGGSEAAEARFLSSDLLQMTGQVDAALEPLITVLQFPATPEIAVRARHRIDLLVNAREQQLINAGDLPALVAYLERLVSLEPGNDAHRLKLARWLIRTEELEKADRLLREVGYVGVTPEEIEAVTEELKLASSRLPVERSAGALFTGVNVTTRKRSATLRMLIDTGATMTGIVERRLDALGAERLSRQVPVRTANGTVALPVYRIRRMALGSVELGGIEVLGLRDDLPESADGLLGMDVMDRLPRLIRAPPSGR